MSFEEKVTWANAVVATAVSAVYFAVVFGQLGRLAASEIAYQWPLLVAIGAGIVLNIVCAILVGIGSGIATGISNAVSGDDLPLECAYLKDERDTVIGRQGELVGYYVLSAGAVAVLALTMLKFDYFWIANVLYLSFVVASVVSSAVKIAAYRRGF